MAVRLTSVDELKDFLRIPAAETGQDARLAVVIEDVSSECEAFTARTFTKQGYSNEPHFGGRSSVVLNNYPVDSAASFQVKSFDSWGSLTIVDPSDYIVDYNLGIVRLLGGLIFGTGANGAQVSYTAGYVSVGASTAQKLDVPGAVSRAARILCAAMYRHQAGIIDTKELCAVTEEAQKQWSSFIRV